MARELGVPLHEFDFPGSRLQRQVRALVSTLSLLLKARPSVVFAPNPSLVLTFLLLACRALFRFRLVTDAHYGGVISVTGSRLIQRLLDFANARADLVIVTNRVHADRIRGIGGTPFICPDPLPGINAAAARPAGLNGARKSVLFICSFDLDEPFPAVFQAAGTLARHGFTLFASGQYSRAGLTADSVPHAVLLGFVDRPTYDAYLQNVDIVLDLTTWEDCLVCGAYEAMAAGKPCVLSRTPALTDLFTHGTVFSSHDPDDIVSAVLTAYERRDVLRAQIADWRVRHRESIRERIGSLRSTTQLPPWAA
jgi:glycosyltransferase involved in cell wall biosynthesis